MPQGDREAHELTELGGLTQAQLAEQLGLSVTGTKSKVRRARSRLDRVQESTGLVVSKNRAEETPREAARSFDAFYACRSRRLPPPMKTGAVLVAAVDCKGVPMVKPEAALRVVRQGVGLPR